MVPAHKNFIASLSSSAKKGIAAGAYGLTWLAILMSVFQVFLIAPPKSWAVTGGTTLTVVPSPPSGLTAIDHPADNGRAVDLSWTPSTSPGVTEQRIYKATTTGGPYSLAATIINNTTATYTDSTGLTNGTTYYYVVRAFGSGQESGNSNEVNAVPSDNIAPVIPTSLVAADVAGDNGGAIVLNWTPSASGDVTQQRIYRGTTTSGPYGTLVTTIINNTTSTYTNNTGLTNGTTYYYVIRAYDGTQESANSIQGSAAPVDNVAPTAPTLLSAADVAGDNGGAIVLNWTPSVSTDVTGQRVYRATVSGGPYSLVTTIANNTTTTYTDSGLTNGTTYYYVVRAYDGTNESANSNQSSAIPIGGPSATTSTVTATTPVYANGVSPSTVTITIRDGTNSPVSGATVTLSSSRGAADTITQPVGTTNASGQITGAVRSAIPGNSVMSAVANGTVNLVSTAIITFYNTQTGTNVAVSPTTTSQVTFANVTSVGITSTLANSTGTALPSGYANPDYYDISTTAGYTGTVSICITYNEALYLGNENRVALLHNESGTWVNRTSGPVDTVNNIVCGTVTTFSEFATSMTVATKLAITSLSQTVTAGQASNAVTIQARDANNVLDTSYGGTVTLTSGSANMRFDTSQGGAFNGSITQITLTGGAGTFYFRDTQKGSPVITVNATGLTSDQQTETILAGALNAATTTVTAVPSTITANGTSTAVITVTPRDVYGNTLNPGQTVTLSRISGTGTLLGTVVDNGDGTYTRSVQAPTLTGSGTFQAVVNGVTITQTAVVTYAPGPVAHYVVTTTTPQTAGKGWTETVTAEDVYNNFASNNNSTVTLAGSGGLRFYTGNGYTTETTITTLSGGIATLYLKDNTAETVSFTVTRQGGTETGVSGNITVNAAPVITTTSLLQGTLSISYSRTLASTGGTPPLSWSISSGSLPPGLNMTSAGVISGTPTSAGSYPFTVQLIDSNLVTDTKALSIIINPAPTVSTPGLSDGTAGASYTATLTVAGGTSPFSWSMVSGSLPSGLTLNSATGVISGTPITAGTSSFTVRVTDANGATNNKLLSIMIYSALSISTTSLSDGTVGTAYSQTLSAGGGKTPYSWSVTSGSLPAGLILNGSTGVISGTPSAVGTSNFTVQVQDANGALTTGALAITVHDTLAITTSALSDGTVSIAYSQTVVATGGRTPYIWSITSGSLPAGLTLNSGTGVISGTPTTTGTSAFTVRVTDANSQIASKGFSITLYSGVAIVTAALPDGTVGTAYSTTLTATGGATPYLWSITAGTLPAGLSLNSSSGVISGTPTTGGNYPITVQVTDNNLVTNTRGLSITIYNALTVITSSLADGTVNATYSQMLTASGGKTPYLWSLVSGTLPPGLGLNGSNGLISGTPSSAGTSNFTVQAQDANGALATKALTITVFSAVSIITTSLSDGTVNLIYSQTLTAAGGKTSYAWGVISGTLPAGLSLNSSTGAITGTPATSGASAFTVQVTDANGGTATKALSITIYTALTITTVTLPDGTVGANYNTTVNATGGKNPLVWGLSSGALPAGLSLNSATGVISGMPTTANTSNFTLQVSDANGATASKSYTVTIYSSFLITTSTLADGTVGAAYSQTLTASGGKTPYSWILAGGTLPAGLSLNGGTGVISGTPASAGTSNFTIQVTDGNGATATQGLSLTIYSGLSVTTALLPDGTVSLAYNQTLTASGGKAPLAWSLSAGTLPAGVSLAGATGVISGTPASAGTSNFTMRVTDVNGAVATRALAIVIYPAVSVTTMSLSDGTVGVSYSQTLAATGGKTPYSWSVSSGSLPAGLSLNSTSGVISGTPTVSGTNNFTVQVMDANGAAAAQALLIVIYNPLSVTTTALAAGTITLAYSQTLSASGGKTPYTWGVVSGTLPAGLSLNSTTGGVSGTPTSTGTWNFTMQVSDSGGRTASQALSITIYSGLTITTASLPDGTVTASYSATLNASGGQSPCTWAITVGSLPAGISLNISTGVISGTPTVSGTSNFTMQVTDSNLSIQTKALSITAYPAVSVATTVLSDGTVNAAYTQTLTASGGKSPYTWAVTSGSLPTGLVLNGVTGVISGTPGTSGSYGFTVQVTDANGAVASQALSITVYTAVSVTTVSLVDGTVSASYSQTLTASGGKSPLVWTPATGTLPSGLSLAGATGVISGTPASAGTSNFTVQATDANGAVATKALSVVIYSAVSVTTTALSDGVVGSSYSQTLSATGGKTPYSWANTAGTLPAGLSLNSATGVISGMPTLAGTSNFTIQVTDTDGAVAAQALSITIYDTLTITTVSLSDGTVNLVYSRTVTATGGKAPLVWAITVGVLPAGLSLNSATGEISGTPTTAGTNNMTVRVTDANGFIKDKALSITVYGTVSVSTSALSDGTVNGSYSATLVAAGGKTPYTWSVITGSLPAGLTFNSATGILSGVPTTAGTSNFTIQVTDANGATATQALSILIYSAVSITTVSLSDGTVSLAYTQTVLASGGKTPYTWSVASGTLPAGLSLNSSTGVISGTPTASGTSNFTVRVTDANGAYVGQAMAITIYPVLSITTAALSDGTMSLAYSQTLTSAGGKPSINWSITMGVLPAGLSLNSATGVISGTPTTGGTNNFTMTATDANGAVATQAFSITIYSGLSVTTAALNPATQNTAYSQTLTAAGGKTPYTWAITIGTLPAGLSLNSATGVISGTPTLAGTSNFTVQVTDANTATNTKALSIVVNAFPAVTTTSLSDGTVNLSYSQMLLSSGGTLPVSWSVTIGNLPAGLTLNSSTGGIIGTPTAAGTSNFTVRVTDGNGVYAEQPLSLQIYPALSVTTTALSDGTVNLAYSQMIVSGGGKTPVTWAITAGTLPAGLSLNSATGEISGTPTAAGTSNFTIQATDANGATGNKALSITIYPALSITTASLADGTVNLTYNQTLSASGGKTPYSWYIVTGSLPAGLTLNATTGAISGTPTAAGTNNFTVRVTDANGAITNQPLSIMIYAALTITTASLTDGTLSLAYSQTVIAAGGKPSLAWSITAGALPAGVSLNSSTGVISGTPTLAGTSNFTAQVTDANGAVNTRTLSITIYGGLSVSTTSLSDGTANWTYSQTLTAGGGKTPYTWSVITGSLPAGIGLNSTTGMISGTPTTAGTSSFTVQVTDANGATATQALSITIYTALSLTTTSLNSGTVSAAYSQTVAATGGKTPYSWSVTTGSLPPGLVFNTSTGAISGTPTTGGTFNFSVQVQDVNGATDAKALSIVISVGLSITTGSLPDGTVNLVYNQTLTVSGGSSPFTWALIVGSLPAGLTLNSGTGVISGTPAASGTSNFTVQVTDGNSAVASKSLSITIYGALTITTSSLAQGTRTAAYNQTVVAAGGKTPYAWSVTVGSLPSGLSLDSVTGVIIGVPGAAGPNNFTVQVQDVNGATATQALNIQINDVPLITTASLPGGTSGTSYNQALAQTGGTLSLNWGVASGSLPAGITLNSNTGIISGIPTVSGVYNFTVTLTDIYGVSDSRPYTLTIVPGNPARANISASKTTIVADGTDGAGLTVTVYDANNNLVADGMTVTVTSTNGTMSGTGTTVSGVVSRTITSVVSGAATLGVESPSGTTLGTITGTAALSFIPGLPAQANIVASKTTVIADGVDQTTLTITVRDARGNLVTDGTTVTLTTTLETVTGSGNTMAGVVTRYLSGTATGTATLGVQSPTGTTLSTVTGNTGILFSSGGPGRAVISASKTALIADGVDNSTLTVTVYDANNNLVTNGTTVTVTTTLGTVTGTGTTVNGIVTRLLSGTVSGTAVLGVQAPAGTTLSNVTGNTAIVFNPGSSAQANIMASKTTLVANGTDSTLLTITVRDATGNLVPDGTTVRLTTTLGTVTGSGATVAGVVTRTLTGTVIGTASLGAESPVGTVLATVTGNTSIILQPGLPAGTITLSPSPANIAANGISTSTVTSGVIRDAYNNPVSDGTLITVATNQGSITTADASGVDPGIQVATASGVVSFVVQSSTVIGTAGITAVSIAGSASGSTQIAFVSGTPSAANSSLTATSPVSSDGVSASTVTLIVRDIYNNPISGASVTLSSSRGALDTITQPAGTTAANGQIIGTVASISAGDAILTATVNGSVVLAQTATINFYNTQTGSNVTVSPSSNTTLTFDMVITIGITSTTPSGTGPALPAGYTLPVYVDISTTATFSGNITVCITYNEGTYGGREGLVKLLHDEGGVLVDRTISLNTATNTVCGRVNSFSIFATSVTTATKLQITTAPQTVSAGNVSNIVTVEAQNNNGVLDPGVSGTVDVGSNSTTLKLDTSSTGSFAGNTLSVNIVNGIGNFYFKDTTSGTPTITVTDAGAILTPATQQQTILPSVPSGSITLTPVPASIVANGITTSTVTSGIITDVYGNTVSNGTLMTVSTDRGTVTTTDADAGTAGIQVATGSGVISFVVQSGTVSGTATISAASVQGSASGSTQVALLPALPSGTIALTPVPASIVADGITTSTVTSGVITDANGNTVSNGTLITVATDRGTITTADVSGADPGIQVTTINGVISFVVRSGTVSGTANVTAASVQGGASGNTQIAFLPGLPSGMIALTPTPASIIADGAATSTVISGVITDVYGNTVSDGTLITVATDRGTITTADVSGADPGIQVTTTSGVISFVVRSATVSGTANVTAASVAGSAAGSTAIAFISGLPYGTINLTPNPAIIPADGVSTSILTSGVITDVYGNTVPNGTLITVATDRGTITTADASGADAGIQVATSLGTITLTLQAGTTEGIATVTAASVQGSANGQATVTLTNVPPELNYPSETGYGNGDAVEPNSGIRSTVYTYKIIYRDVNNNSPLYIRICIDSTPCTGMSLDAGAVNASLRDGNYNNGEQYVYTINTLNSGNHTFYFETSDGLAYTKLPPVGSLNGPHVNYPPEFSYSSEAGYGTDGVDPNTGNTTVTFKYKVVYKDLDNQAPSSIRVCIDAACYSMAVDAAASATLKDGDYTNGEQYVYSTLLTDGTHNYYFTASDSLEGVLLPASGNLSGPIVTNTYTPVGTNVLVHPDPDVTVTFTQVTASGDTYVTRSQTGSPLPSGYLQGNPSTYFDIYTTATYTGKVKICYTYNDIQYFGIGYGGERGLRLLHYESGSFNDRTVMLDVNNNMVCGEVYSFSEFSASVEQATLVTLTSFAATGMDGKVLLTWITASEMDSIGFNILRGSSPDGPFTRINDWVIRSKGTSTRGMTYTHEDSDVKNGTTYFYRLENVDINGRIAAHMIASATPGSETVPAGEEILTGHPVPEVPAGGGIYRELPAVIGGESLPVISEPPGGSGEGENMVTETTSTDGALETMPTVGAGAPEKRPEISDPAAMIAKREAPKGFTLKIADDAGNEMEVSLPEETESVQDPFEVVASEDGKITLKWSAKGNLKGFNVLRVEVGQGKEKVREYVKVNVLPMPFFASQGGDKGLVYYFKDAGAGRGKMYSYKVETIFSDGTRRDSGPIEVSTVGMENAK